MTARVFAIAQQKGGVGKTTLAAQLAVAWSRNGRRVALLDTDPQGSLAAWYAARRKTLNGGDEGRLAVMTIGGWRTAAEGARAAAPTTASSSIARRTPRPTPASPCAPPTSC